MYNVLILYHFSCTIFTAFIGGYSAQYSQKSACLKLKIEIRQFNGHDNGTVVKVYQLAVFVAGVSPVFCLVVKS